MKLQFFSEGSLTYCEDPAVTLRHAFLTRSVDAKVLELARSSTEGPERTGHEVETKILRHFSCSNLLLLKQTHSSKIIELGKDLPQDLDGDGFYASRQQGRGWLLGIKTADCVPLVLANDKEIVFLHAGWRGLAHGIVHQGLAIFKNPIEFALIGPHATAQGYEVGREILSEFVSVPTVLPHSLSNKCYLDMASSTASIINRFSEDIKIYQARINTFQDQRFFSVRREGAETGRNLSVVSV